MEVYSASTRCSVTCDDTPTTPSFRLPTLGPGRPLYATRRSEKRSGVDRIPTFALCCRSGSATASFGLAVVVRRPSPTRMTISYCEDSLIPWRQRGRRRLALCG